MTQVFADGDQVADPGMLTRMPVPMQPGTPLATSPPVLGPAMMPGKGVRRIRCVGCAQDTLPRNVDGAPLCQRCSELLAVDAGMVSPAAPVLFRAPRWLRRRSTFG
jgi:hypothetical protein